MERESKYVPVAREVYNERTISPLKHGEIIEAMNMADQDNYLHEMFANIRFMDRWLAVPLAQLQPIDADESTTEAIEDWHYWMGQGYQFWGINK